MPPRTGGKEVRPKKEKEEVSLNEAVDRMRGALENSSNTDPQDLRLFTEKLESLAPINAILFLKSLPAWIYPSLEHEIGQIASQICASSDATDSSLYHAMELLASVPGPQASTLLFETLKRAPKYQFPAAVSNPWSVAGSTRGYEGAFAQFCVRNGSPTMMEEYCERIINSDKDTQRVLIWAMKVSSQYADFDFLLQLRSTVIEHETAKEIDSTLDQIAKNLDGLVVKTRAIVGVDDNDTVPVQGDALKSDFRFMKATVRWPGRI